MFVEKNGSAARYHPDGSAVAVRWVLGGEGCGGWGAAKDNIARGKAYGDGAHRPDWPLRGAHGRVPSLDNLRRQRLEVDAA